MKTRLNAGQMALGLLLFFMMGVLGVQGQCVVFDEDDFSPASILATEGGPNPSTVTSNQIDIWHLANFAPGSDGIMDVEIVMNAGLFNPNSGACADGDFTIGSSIGGAPLPNTGPNSSSDMGAFTSDDCVCETGYITWTYRFLNGFSSTAAGLNLLFTSSNGVTEGIESTFGYVTAGTQSNGTTALTGLASPTIANLATFCNAQYLSTDMATHLGLSGPGFFAMDEPTGGTNNCVTSGEGGEDTASGDNPNDNSSFQAENPNLGLNPTDIVTEFQILYVVSTSSGTDCDGDGDTGVDTRPSASIGNITVCPPPPPCGIMAEITIVEKCGAFDVIISNVTYEGSADGYTVGMGTSPTGPFTSLTGTYTTDTTIENVTAISGGTEYFFQLSEDDESNCENEFGPISSPKSNTPLIIAFPGNCTGE